MSGEGAVIADLMERLRKLARGWYRTPRAIGVA